MIDGPIGAARYNNEFGRPNILGYFRTLECQTQGTVFGYHKPIMLAGGIGNINAIHTHKEELKEGNLLIQLWWAGNVNRFRWRCCFKYENRFK
ncbi:MAG: hypothetical protein ACJZ18_04940 [Methylophilaceae bacterium]